ATIDLASWDGSRFLAVFRTVRVKAGSDAPLVVIIVAMDRAQLAASREMVVRLLPISLAALAAMLALAMAAFVHRALSPFRALRDDLQRVHDGMNERLGDGYPSEVQPLVDDLNRLVAQQKEALDRARAQAADMAHGLKTPLAVLDAMARRIEDRHPAVSAEISEQSLAMQGQVSRTLARARTASAAGLRQRRTPITPVVEQLVSAMKRLPGSERIDWRVEVPPTAVYPASEGELLEALGNLVDNARKWARSDVSIVAKASGPVGAITVEDDGPGMAAEEMAEIGRGRRWDETTPGSGFGLAITQDLAIAAGGRLTLSRGASGGLSAVISWG
ncbi:MAG: HAMP domain-containing sensor histidine kinase, partial [Hansschlegelia sp.]